MTDVADAHYQQPRTTQARIAPHTTAQWTALAAVAFCYPTVVALTKENFVYDDPFILMRYAQHLASGAGWNFNVGSVNANAATSPLYVLLLSAGKLLSVPLTLWSVCLYTTAWGAGAILLARVLVKERWHLAPWLACGLYSISPLLTNVRGMETSVYLLLIVAGIWALQRERWIVLGCLLGLLTTARADAVLYAMAMVTWVTLRRRRLTALTVAVPFFLITVCWIGAQWVMTGTPFPSTLTAKLAQRDSGIFGSQWTFLQMLHVYGIVGGDGGSPARVIALGLVGVAMLGMALFATALAATQRNLAVPWLAVAAAIVVLEYGVAFRMPAYHWHYGPFTLWVIAATAVGLEELLRRHRRILATTVAAAALAASVTGAGCHLPGLKEAHAHYREVAEWLDRDSPAPHPTVALGEIGTIGYYSRANIIDYMGLLDARAVDPVRHRDFSWWLSQKPDYWVTASAFTIDDQTTALPQFERTYKRAATFGSVIVYRRR